MSVAAVGWMGRPRENERGQEWKGVGQNTKKTPVFEVQVEDEEPGWKNWEVAPMDRKEGLEGLRGVDVTEGAGWGQLFTCLDGPSQEAISTPGELWLSFLSRAEVQSHSTAPNG